MLLWSEKGNHGNKWLEVQTSLLVSCIFYKSSINFDQQVFLTCWFYAV